MRIPFPERIPLNRAAIFAAAFAAVQKLEGTPLYFCVGCAIFIVIAALAFNAAGGLTRCSGAYIFSYSMLVVIIGIFYKACLGEPAQTNLLAPRSDIAAYVGSIAVMYAAVIVSRRFSRKVGLLQTMLKESAMYRASVGCIVFGAGGGFLIAILGESGAKLQSAFGQLNQLIPLGIVIGVMYEIRRSGGTRSSNLLVTLGGLYIFFLGVVGFSKQGMLTPLYCWLLPVCALRFRLSLAHVLACLLAVFMFFHYLAPFSQYGRGFVDEDSTLGQRIDIATRLLEHPQATRNAYTTSMEDTLDQGGYYNKPQGFWDRLQFVSVDDSLINFTNQGHTFGLWPLEASLLNAIPHVFWPDKPIINFGNTYAHELGGLAADDTSTGISFSPTSEAYHMAKWTGVLIVAPLIWLLFFFAFDSLFGDIRATPWGLLAMVEISHIAPEGALTGLIYLLTTGAFVLVFCAIFASWFAPLFAIPILGPDRPRISNGVDMLPAQPNP